jgi:hypothetical protein
VVVGPQWLRRCPEEQESCRERLVDQAERRYRICHREGVKLLILAASFFAVAAGMSSAGVAPTATFRPCAASQIRVPEAQPNTGFFEVSKVSVSRLSCSTAKRVIRAGSFELTPGGPTFGTPGWHCSSPVGPPTIAARYFICRHGPEAFRFPNFQ